MTTAVDQAAGWAREMTRQEARGPGDMENTWRRLENRYGISFNTFWSLRYRKPKEIVASVYLRLHAAYRAEHQRQMRKLANEIAITEAVAGIDNPVIREVQTLVDSHEGQNED